MDDANTFNMYSEIYSVSPERWCIKNSFDQYWNGEKFISDKSNSALYDTIDRSNGDVHKLLIEFCTSESTEHRQFVLPILIDTYGDPNISEDDIIDYLMRSLSMSIDFDAIGNWHKNNLVLPTISWELKKKENDE